MPDAPAITREYIDAWNRRDWTRYRELYHPGYSYTGGDVQNGPDAGLALAQMWATPSLTPRSMFSASTPLATTSPFASSLRGTHQSELMGVAPTGRKVTVPICDAIEVRDGKVYAEREYFDMQF